MFVDACHCLLGQSTKEREWLPGHPQEEEVRSMKAKQMAVTRRLLRGYPAGMWSTMLSFRLLAAWMLVH